LAIISLLFTGDYIMTRPPFGPHERSPTFADPLHFLMNNREKKYVHSLYVTYYAAKENLIKTAQTKI
jgi:hypothetical protein